MTTVERTTPYRPLPTLLRWLRPQAEPRRAALRHGPTPRYEALAIGLGCARPDSGRDDRPRGR